MKFLVSKIIILLILSTLSAWGTDRPKPADHDGAGSQKSNEQVKKKITSWKPTELDKNNYKFGVQAYQKQDNKTALKYLQPLAEKGLREAAYLVGNLNYFSGKQQEAVKWFKRAAIGGKLPEAMYGIGYIYFDCWFVSRGPNGTCEEHEYMWMRLAADLGHKKAKKRVGQMAQQEPRTTIKNGKALAKACVAKSYRDCEK